MRSIQIFQTAISKSQTIFLRTRYWSAYFNKQMQYEKNSLSFEPDSNQWPMDNNEIPLQSTALPTELSKAAYS